MDAKDVPAGTAQDRFWRAIEVAAHGELEQDITDVGRYVASRGRANVAEFEVELCNAIGTLRTAGIAEVLRGGTTTTDGRALVDLEDSDLDHALEHLLVTGGRRYFEWLLEKPSLVASSRPQPTVDLLGSVHAAEAEEGIDSRPLWQEKRGDRRRNGERWIQIYQGMGVGLSWNAPPWTTRGVRTRYLKAAILRSHDDSWRTWRADIGAQRLDVTIEYWKPTDQPEHVEILKQGRTTEVVVYRSIDRLTGSDEPVLLAEREAEAVFDNVWTTLLVG